MKRIGSVLVILLLMIVAGQSLAQKPQESDRKAAEKVFREADTVLNKLAIGETISKQEVASFKQTCGTQVIVRLVLPTWKKPGQTVTIKTEVRKLSAKELNKIVDAVNNRGANSYTPSKFEDWLSWDYGHSDVFPQRKSINEWAWKGAYQMSWPGKKPMFNKLKLKKVNGVWKLSEIEIIKLSYLGD